MGQPTAVLPQYSLPESIGFGERTRGSETSQYPEEQKSKEIPQVAASERGHSPNRSGMPLRGCGTDRMGVTKHYVSRTQLESWAIQGDSPVDENIVPPGRHPSTTGHVISGGNLGGPPSKAKYVLMTDSELVP